MEKITNYFKQEWIREFIKIAWIPVAVCWFGAILNIIVVHANGGMPVPYLDFAFDKWTPLTDQTHFMFLGDLIPVGDWQFSIGDTIMWTSIPIYVWVMIKTVIRYIKQPKRSFV